MSYKPIHYTEKELDWFARRPPSCACINHFPMLFDRTAQLYRCHLCGRAVTLLAAGADLSRATRAELQRVEA